MGPTSSIPHGKSILGEDCSLWLELSAAGVEGVDGFIARYPVHRNAGVCHLRVFDRTHSSACRGSCEGNVHHIDSSGVFFVNDLPSFSRRLFPYPGGEPRVGGLQRWQLYPGRSFHVGTVGRQTVFGFGTVNGASVLLGMAAHQVGRLVLVSVEHLYRHSRGPWPPSN